MQDYYDQSVCVGIGPNGRSRRSDPHPKPHNPASCGITNLIVPVISIGGDLFKPPMKKEPLAKPWYKFQWYCSPRKIYSFTGRPIEKEEGEDKKVFCRRCDEIMVEEEKRYSAIVAQINSKHKHWKDILLFR